MHRLADHHHDSEHHSHEHGHRHGHRHGHHHGHRHGHGHRHEHHHAHDHEEHDEYEEEYDEALYEYYGELERKVGLKLFSNLIKTLKKDGTAKLDEHQLSIVEEAGFSITHEETWDGTEKLTLEIEWYPQADESDEGENADVEEQSLPTFN